jgi:hypothetical protein
MLTVYGKHKITQDLLKLSRGSGLKCCVTVVKVPKTVKKTNTIMPSDVQQTSQKQSNVSQRSLMVLARCLRWNRWSYVRAASHHRHTRILCYDEMRCVCVREVIFPESARRLTRPFWARVLILFLTSRWHRGCARPLTDRYNIRDTKRAGCRPGRGRCERGKRIERELSAPCDGIAMIASLHPNYYV